MIRQLISLACDTCGRSAGSVFPADGVQRALGVAQSVGWSVQRLTGAPGFGHAICPPCNRKTEESA